MSRDNWPKILLLASALAWLPVQAAHAVTATVYSDSNSNGQFDSGEQNNTFLGGDGGSTHLRSFDIGPAGNLATPQVTIDFPYIDNSVRVQINGSDICAPSICQFQADAHNAATQAFLRFAGGDFVEPWLENVNGLPRLRVTVTPSSITITGTRTTTATALSAVTFSSGGLGSPPVFVNGQNDISVVNPDDVGPDAIEGLMSAIYDNYTPQIAVTKTPSVGLVSSANTPVSYSIVVTNTGDVGATGLTVADALAPATCPTSGSSTIAALAPGASETCSAGYIVTQADIDNGGGGDDDIDNTVSVSGSTIAGPVSDSASAAVLLDIAPSMSIAKSADTTDGVNTGQVITYTYVVTNTGNVTMFDVNVSDSHNGYGPAPVPAGETQSLDAGTPGDSTDDVPDNGTWSRLAPGDAVTFTGTYTVTQSDIDLLQ